MSNNVNLENKYTNIVSNDYKHISTSITFTLLILPITNITNIIKAIKHLHISSWLIRKQRQDGANPRGSVRSPPRLDSGFVAL